MHTVLNTSLITQTTITKSLFMETPYKMENLEEHAKINFKINLSKFTITIGLITSAKKYILLNLILN